jgi:hypothetical protein
MATHLRRSIDCPIREGLSWDELLWRGPDRGLICCWERGRQKRVEEPELAARADKGELVTLAWKGGVEEKLKIEKKPGTLKYLATWQGLRAEDLNLAFEDERVIVCTKTGQTVVFGAKLLEDKE